MLGNKKRILPMGAAVCGHSLERYMVRIVIDIDGDDDLATKEAVAMRLEPLGKIRVVSVDDGKGKK